MGGGLATIKRELAGFLLVLAMPCTAVELPTKPLAALASPSFQEREKGQAEIVEWARQQQKPPMDELLRQSRDAADPEVRLRCLNALKELVNDEYQRDGEGYIGIAMRDEVANVPGDGKPRSVIRITMVQEGTAAEEAGLRMNDLIVSMNDEIWHEGEPSGPLRGKIRMMKPGTKTRLGILREDKVLKVEVTLRRRPVASDMMFPNNPNFDPEALERAAREAYFREWLNQRKAGK